jgi:hypothetical protein
MKQWRYHRVEARTREQLDLLLDECGRNCWELVHVEKVIALKQEGATTSKTRNSVPAIPTPIECWLLFFKQAIQG